MSNSKTVLRISFALALISATLILLAFTFGFFPDEEKAEREARASIAESLAIQVISATGRNDLVAVNKTIKTVVARNKSVLSIALRKSNGTIVAKAGPHAKHWVALKNGVSTPTHIYVPINNRNTFWGALEMSFQPLPHSAKILGVPTTIAILIILLGAIGLVGNFFILKRSLRELDPSRVVPERVQKAFDTLAEGVLILDDRGLILLSNASFAKELNTDCKALVGTEASSLPWAKHETAQNDFPWSAAMRDPAPIAGASLRMDTPDGQERMFTVNATRISDDKGKMTGVIVTFDDVTELEMKNGELNQLVSQLKEKEVEVNLKNRELHHLATRDPLTDCLNRRAFFDAFQLGIDHCRKDGTPVYCMMMDLDHFKSVNDQYGHGIGDDVIVLMGDILKSACRETDLAGRYGGEEFCLALFGLDEEHCFQVAERIRHAITERAKSITVLEHAITTSIGMVKMGDGVFDPNELISLADKALYAAKSSGRNRVIDWKNLSPEGVLLENIQPIEPADPPLSEVSSELLPPASTPLPAENNAELARETTPIERRTNPQISMPFVETREKYTTQELLQDRLTNAMARAKRNDKVIAVVFIKITSDFQFDNDKADVAGQELNETLRTRIAKCLRESDSVSPLYLQKDDAGIAHLSHDTFAVQIADIEGIDPVVWIVKRLINVTSTPIRIMGNDVQAVCHAGVSLYPGDGDNAFKLCEKARAAATYAQEQFANSGFYFTSKSMNDHVKRQMVIEFGLRTALKANELSLHYQPIIDLSSGRVISLEALLRCTNDMLAGVPTTMMIEIAEQSGLISEIDQWSFTHAIAQFQHWAECGIQLEKIAVNLSNVQLGKSGTTERLIDIMKKMNFDPSQMQVEVKESSLNQKFTNARRSLQELQKEGVSIALDDFGGGSSSLTTVKQLQPAYIKIDQMHVQEIVDADSDLNLISAIIAMSHALGMKVIAEGVETEIQLEKLVELQCDFAQGNLLSAPMEANRIVDWLRLFTKKSTAKHKSRLLG